MELPDEGPLIAFSPALLDRGVEISASETAVKLAPDHGRRPAGPARRPSRRCHLQHHWLSKIVPVALRDAVSARGNGVAVVAAIVAVAALVVLGQLVTLGVRPDRADDLSLRAMGAARAELIAEPATRASVELVCGSTLRAALAVVLSAPFPLGFVADLDPADGILSIHSSTSRGRCSWS